MNRPGLFGGNALMAPCSMLCVAYGDTQHGSGGVPVTLAQWADGARSFDGLGNFHRAVTANSKEALAYFDHGMVGAALLRAGRPEDTATVYLEDLRRHSDNGWALFGLAQSLAAQHKDAEALAVRQHFDKAWTSAGITLTASAF